MKRYVTFLSLSLCIHFSAHTQRVTLIEVLPELNSQTASFWNQATMQHDIIGSDFRGKKEIGNASAERFEGLGPAPDFWFPIGIHKKTIGGELTDMYIFDLGDDLPDLFLLDVVMPGLNGLETCKWLKSQHADLPVIIRSLRLQVHAGTCSHC